MAFWRRRDHEKFIGSYDPEHEMPNPDRRPHDRPALHSALSTQDFDSASLPTSPSFPVRHH